MLNLTFRRQSDACLSAIFANRLDTERHEDLFKATFPDSKRKLHSQRVVPSNRPTRQFYAIRYQAQFKNATTMMATPPRVTRCWFRMEGGHPVTTLRTAMTVTANENQASKNPATFA